MLDTAIGLHLAKPTSRVVTPELMVCFDADLSKISKSHEASSGNIGKNKHPVFIQHCRLGTQWKMVRFN